MLQKYDLSRIHGMIPFNICMLGMRRSGKSVASFKLAEYLSPEFDMIVSFLGTKNCNIDLCELISKHDSRLNFVEFNPLVIQTLLKQQEYLLSKGVKRRVLIVFDDVFATCQRHVELLTQLFIRGRHYQISIINSAVCFTTIQKNCRRCLDILFLYSSVCRSDNQVLSSEYIHNSFSTAQYALQNLPPYTALVIETKRNQKLYELKFQYGLASTQSGRLGGPDDNLNQVPLDQLPEIESVALKTNKPEDTPKIYNNPEEQTDNTENHQ